jgi:hypothetical protein
MLFAHNALASGPQACFFAEKAIAKVKVGKEDICLDSPGEKVYDNFISCKEFWFGTKTSR